jgi:peptidoglycan-associated lipoprotein
VRLNSVGLWARGIVPVLVVAMAACGPKPPAVSPQAAADSAAAAARRDSLAAAQARADSLAAAARRDSIAAAARADSLARAAAERARADSIRAEVRRNELAAAAQQELAPSIHFAFDRSNLDATATGLLDRKVAFLQANPTVVIQIAGNCDERGSDEYNLALGNRRAAAAKKYLVEHGIEDARISIISYGEERPVDPRHNETAWAANRRDDFVVVSGLQ